VPFVSRAKVFGPPYEPQRRPGYVAFAPLFGTIALAGIASAVSCFVAGAVETDPGQASAERIGGVIASVPAAVFTIVFAVAVSNGRRAPREAALRPLVGLTRQGGTLGFSAAF